MVAPRKGKRKRTPKGRIVGAPRDGQLTLDLKSAASLRLRDKIPENVHTLFVGVNPGMRSAQIGHYFAGHNNSFWKLIHASGIWPVSLTTEEDDQMTAAGFGFTDTCKRPAPGTQGLTKGDFVSARNRIRKIARAYSPRMIVFVSKTAFRIYLGDIAAEVRYGFQAQPLNGARVFLVPSTSGRSLRHSSYRTKLMWFKRLREAMDYWVPAA